MAETPRFTARSRGLVRAATAIIVGLLFASGVTIWLLRQGALADTEQDDHRLGVVLAEQTTRTFQAVDLVLQEMSAKVAVSNVDDLRSLHEKFGGDDVHDALTKRLVDLQQAIALIIVDSAGRLVNISRQLPGPDYSVADREYYKHFATTVDQGPFISEPAVGHATGIATIFLTRRITGLDGRFLGVLIASIRLDYFSSFFARTDLSDGTGITILRRDGRLLVRFPNTGIMGNQQQSPNQEWYRMVAAGGGNYRAPGVFSNHAPILVSVQPLTLFPIVVDVTRTEKAALARWRGQAIIISLGVAAATVSLTLLLRALSRQITIIEASQTQIAEQVATITTSEARLATQSALLETTLDHMDQGLMMVDAAGTIAVCNRRAREILDLPVELMATGPRLVDVIEFQRNDGEFAVSQGTPIDPALLLSDHAVYERRRPTGTVIEVRTAPLPRGGLVRTYTDITARAAAEEMLSRAASHDHLTGLANRNGFNARLDAALVTAQREHIGLAILCMDLDRFKAVNDTLGHGAGDQLLILVADRMRQTARKSDVIGRLGGDEFAIILSDADQAGAEHLSQRLLDAVRLPYSLGNETARIGISIGIAIYPVDGRCAEDLLRNADTALYKAKAAGRNTWCAYASEDRRREHERIMLEQDVRTAVEARQFTLAYQPICDGSTSVPVAFEALLRWNHPTRGAVSPADFIPITEQTGLILPLGRWVIEVACAEAAAWAVPLRIAVNLSPAQFRDHDLLGFIRDVLSRTGLPANRLDLEVTEGLLLENADDVVQTMKALKAMGISMVLDDFGTAHSNLSYLRGFPFDAVKIDRSFLRALNSDQQARALVEAMLAMARALNLDVIGEGVETQEQLALLTHLQCRWVQGYLLGRAAPSEETRAWICKLAATHTRTDKPVIHHGSTAPA